MAGQRYKAYLSYSHTDERWALWLHRALERYRIPKRLSSEAGHRLPTTLAPVFRDREDLSSASDLSGHLREALEQSEALVVICSPSAAASRWVNEEVRIFKALGRGNHIFCVVVDGEIEAPPHAGGCFPPALIDRGEERISEPLATDARDFADGKRLALLKLIAGLLDVRLDMLRRRDLARRRRLQLVAGVATCAGLALAGLTLTAKLAEREARQAEQLERAQAEQMAAFIVDLGEELGSNLDLESLGRMSATAMSYLDRIDPRQLSVETRIKVGTALRLVGDVNWNQGKIEAAEEAFDRSRALFLALDQAFPGDDEILFQLAQAEFYSGYVHLDQGESDTTRKHWRRYLSIAKDRHDARPDDPRWLLELSYATSNLVNIGIDLGEPVDDEVLAAIRGNIELAARAVQAYERDPVVMRHYLGELAFAADALASVCNLQDARAYRLASLAVTEQLASQAGASVDQLIDVAHRHAGIAGVLAELGDSAAARAHLETAAAEFERQLNQDTSNEVLAIDLASAHRRLARLLSYDGALAAASNHLTQARRIIQPVLEDTEVTVKQRDEFRSLVLAEVAFARLAGRTRAALDLLARHRALLTSPKAGAEATVAERAARVEYRYEHWRLTGADPAADAAELLLGLPQDAGAHTSCDEADLLARHAAMVNDEALLSSSLSYLERAGYRSPRLAEFCRSEPRCGSAND